MGGGAHPTRRAARVAAPTPAAPQEPALTAAEERTLPSAIIKLDANTRSGPSPRPTTPATS
eukprot:3855746-Pyramimonas_sp.AAC.1